MTSPCDSCRWYELITAPDDPAFGHYLCVNYDGDPCPAEAMYNPDHGRIPSRGATDIGNAPPEGAREIR